MSKTLKKQLSKRQLAVINDLFAEGMDESRVLARHKLSTAIYRKWLQEGVFADELRFRIDAAHRQSWLIIARYAPLAAAKLVSLTESEKEETARKACLDVISLRTGEKPSDNMKLEPDTDEISEKLPDGLASKLLEVMAGEMGKNI